MLTACTVAYVVFAITAGALADAFLVGLAVAVAGALVAAVVGYVKWIIKLDDKIDNLGQCINTGLLELSLRLGVVEVQVKPGQSGNGEKTMKDTLDRIEHSTAVTAKRLGDPDGD